MYLELSVAMRNLWCLEKKSILPLIISATGIGTILFLKIREHIGKIINKSFIITDVSIKQ
jgi:hypothetical protein